MRDEYLKSPFRYPGGKGRWTDRILERMPDGYLEASTDLFVGGGSVALALLDAGVKRLVINDADPWMGAFWSVVVEGGVDCDDLCRMVRHAKPTISKFRDLREITIDDDVERAFRAVFFNRTMFSGISPEDHGT